MLSEDGSDRRKQDEKVEVRRKMCVQVPGRRNLGVDGVLPLEMCRVLEY